MQPQPPQFMGYGPDGQPIWGPPMPPTPPAPAPQNPYYNSYPAAPQQPMPPQAPEPAPQEWEQAPDDYYENLRPGQEERGPSVPFLRAYPGPKIPGMKPVIGYRFGGTVISAETRQQSEQNAQTKKWLPKKDKNGKAMFETVLTLQTDLRDEGPGDDGVRRYATKNFQERQLVEKIAELTGRKQKPFAGLQVFFTCTGYQDPATLYPVNQWTVEVYAPANGAPAPAPQVQPAGQPTQAAYSQGTNLLDRLAQQMPPQAQTTQTEQAPY